MIFSRRVWLGLALCAALAGVGLIVLSAAGFALGWNDVGGLRYGSNIVPFTLFAGICALFLAGAVILLRVPEILPGTHGLFAILLLAILAFGFVAVELRNTAPLIRLPVDLVMGSESQFVDHVIRYRAGQPQYTPLDDANSSPYAPAPHLLTYWIAALAGGPTSIPAYRMVQQLYLLVAVLFGAFAARSLLLWIRPDRRPANLWLLFWIPFLYLIANNPVTNTYSFSLYSDALGLAANAIALWLFVEHITSNDDRWLIPMAIIPALGFLAKQKEVVWIGLYVVYFLLIGRISQRRIQLFLAACVALVVLAVGSCYAIWGQPFWTWNFQVLSHLHISPQVVISQIGKAGWYILPGLIGGMLLLRGQNFSRLFPVWMCWLLHLCIATYTSGVAFRPTHLGASTFLGAVWFVVGLATLWPERTETESPQVRAFHWLCAALVPFAVFASMLGADLPRPRVTISADFRRYISAIEKEFEGMPRDKVLMDTGSWVYLPQNIVMKDRLSPLGTLWGTGSSDLAATAARFRQHYYAKILWRTEKIVRRDALFLRALEENYRQVRVIPAPVQAQKVWIHPFVLNDVIVYEPIPPGDAAANSSPPAGKPPT